MIRDRVVIIGGGLAGLSAAVELVERGFDVTLVEAGERCGGKLSAWRDEEGDPVEHGMHGWWTNYVNFLDLMKRVRIPDSALKVPPGTLAMMPDGTEFPLKPLLIRLPSPLFLVAYFFKSPVRGAIDLLSVVRAGLRMLSFDAKRDFKGLDRFTFRSWLWRLGVSRRMYDAFFEPYVRSFAFDSSSRISAAAVLSSYQLYLLRHQNDILARWLTDDPDSLVIEPIVSYIRERGGRIITGVSALGLEVDASGRVIALRTSRPVEEDAPREPAGVNAVARVDQRAIPEQGFLEVPVEHGHKIRVGRENGKIVADGGEGSRRLGVSLTGGGVVVRSDGGDDEAGVEVARLPLANVPPHGFVRAKQIPPIYVGRDGGQNGVIALSGICTHAGGIIEWRDELNAFVCPVHAATFGADGRVTNPPATRPLDAYKTRVDGSDLVVLSETANNPTLEGEHFILAVDVEACKRLLSDRLRELDAFRRIDFLGTTPVVVVRLWFPGANLLGDRTSGVFVDYRLLDNFFVLSNLHESFRDRDETVVEVQAYIVKDEIELPEEDLMELVLADLRRAFPVLKMPPRKFYVLRHKSVFTFHSAGSDEYRPDTRTPLPNLYMAGDWVMRASETWNMERAVATGKSAAVALVEDSGGVGSKILVAPPGGKLFDLSVAALRAVGGFGARVGRWLRGDPPPAPAVQPVARGWRSSVLFAVVKFRGEPNEQLVTGSFRDVTGGLRLERSDGKFKASGLFRIDLESFDSGIALRDYNVRTVVLNAPQHPFAEFRLIEARAPGGGLLATILDKEFALVCEGELTLNNVTRALRFSAKATLFSENLVDARIEEEIVIRAGDFGLDLEALRARCGAVVNDEIRLGFRLAIPYESQGKV